MNCDNCDNEITISLAPYGASFMAVYACPTCGVSYDTNLDDNDIKQLEKEGKK